MTLDIASALSDGFVAFVATGFLWLWWRRPLAHHEPIWDFACALGVLTWGGNLVAELLTTSTAFSVLCHTYAVAVLLYVWRRNITLPPRPARIPEGSR